MTVSRDGDARRTEAEALAAGLEVGVVAPAEVIAWADAAIAADPAPDPALIEVALAVRASAADLAGGLRALPGRADPVAVQRLALARLAAWLRGDPVRRVAHAAWLLAFAGDREPWHVPALRPVALAVDDAVDLDRAGVVASSRAALADELLAALDAAVA